MIYDHIKNIGLYKGLTPAIDLALDYVGDVTPKVEVGTHLLDLGVKAVVSEYVTRPTGREQAARPCMGRLQP
jgi:beta-galactosidase beta subunit